MPAVFDYLSAELEPKARQGISAACNLSETDLSSCLAAPESETDVFTVGVQGEEDKTHICGEAHPHLFGPVPVGQQQAP